MADLTVTSPLSHTQPLCPTREIPVHLSFIKRRSFGPKRRGTVRKQTGTIVQFCGRWYVRYSDYRTENATLVRKKLSHCLGKVTTKGKRPPADIEKSAEDFMQTINESIIPPEHSLSLADFVESVYLPWVKQNRRPSTYKNCRDVWNDHLQPVSQHDRAILRQTRTFTVQKWLNQIGKEDLSRNSLKRIKSTISGMFTLAKQLGYFDGVNPVQGTSVNPHASEAAEMHAYSLEEINSMLMVFPEPASTAFAVAAYAGLRRGEIEGLEWTDYHDGALWVSRSIWNGRELPTKTKKSTAPVPVIRQLADRLELHRLRCSNPPQRAYLCKQPGNACLDEQSAQSPHAAGLRSLPALRTTQRQETPETKPQIRARPTVADLARMARSKTRSGDKPLSVGSCRQSHPGDPAPFERQPHARVLHQASIRGCDRSNGQIRSRNSCSPFSGQ